MCEGKSSSVKGTTPPPDNLLNDTRMWLCHISSCPSPQIPSQQNPMHRCLGSRARWRAFPRVSTAERCRKRPRHEAMAHLDRTVVEFADGFRPSWHQCWHYASKQHAIHVRTYHIWVTLQCPSIKDKGWLANKNLFVNPNLASCITRSAMYCQHVLSRCNERAGQA